MRKIQLTAIIEEDADGYYAYCPELKGCQTQGKSLDETMANLREATELYLETLSPDEMATVGHKTFLSTTLELTCA